MKQDYKEKHYILASLILVPIIFLANKQLLAGYLIFISILLSKIDLLKNLDYKILIMALGLNLLAISQSPFDYSKTILTIISDFFLIALPEECFFRITFYSIFKELALKKAIILNTIFFLGMHLPFSGYQWTFILLIPSLILAIIGYKKPNIIHLSILHLGFNLFDKWISGNFTRDLLEDFLKQ